MSDSVLAPRSASPPYVVDAISKALGRDLNANDVVYDLGCGGDARIIIALAQAAAQQAAAASRSTAVLQQQCSRSCGSGTTHAHTTSSNTTRATVLHASTAAAEGRGELLPELWPEQQQQKQCIAASATHRVPGDTTTTTTLSDAATGHQEQQQQQQQRQEGPASQLPRFVGIELDEAAAARATATVAQLQDEVCSAVKVVHGDLLQTALYDATVVYAYLLPKGLSLLSQKLSEQLRPGSTVLTYMFKIPGWEHLLQATLSVTSGQPNRIDVSGVSKLYVYHV